jgi:hypothetical protein
MRLPTPLLVLITALSGLASCGGGSGDDTDVIRADSSGVRIITSGTRDTALAWTFEEIDVFRDSAGAPWLFNGLVRFQVLSDRAGRTYVLTRDPSIVRFGRTGRHELTIGRAGGGPGEFQFPTSIGAQGDTVWVHDLAKRGLVRFGPEFTPIADQRLEGAIARADIIYFRTGGLWFRQLEVADSAMVSAVYADTLGTPPIARAVMPQGGPVNLGCLSISASSPIFSPQVMMHASVARLLVNAQPTYELWLFEGPRAVASIRRPLAPRKPTVEDVRLLYPEGMIVNRGQCIVPVEKLIEQQGVADVMPAVFDVVLLSDGTMWALRTPPRAAPVVDVFGSDGVYEGTMRGRGLPLALLPNGELLFAKEDAESGGQVVARMRVRR